MNDYQTLQVTQQDGIVTITLNRPDAANGLNHQMALDLLDVAKQCHDDATVRAVVLTAEGRFFSAGGDVKEMYDSGDQVGDSLKTLADNLHASLSKFARMPSPMIVAINGTAAGAGFSMAVSGDLVLIAQSAKMTMAYAGVGLSPDGSSSYYLPRLIGLRKTQDLMLTNRVLSAQDAYDIGLVTEVVDDDKLAERAQQLAMQLAQSSPQSNAAIKKLLLSSFNNSLETQMDLETTAISECAASANGREGVDAFVNKRKPEFK